VFILPAQVPPGEGRRARIPEFDGQTSVEASATFHAFLPTRLEEPLCVLSKLLVLDRLQLGLLFQSLWQIESHVHVGKIGTGRSATRTAGPLRPPSNFERHPCGSVSHGASIVYRLREVR